jgi:hypothetical protein
MNIFVDGNIVLIGQHRSTRYCFEAVTSVHTHTCVPTKAAIYERSCNQRYYNKTGVYTVLTLRSCCSIHGTATFLQDVADQLPDPLNLYFVIRVVLSL